MACGDAKAPEAAGGGVAPAAGGGAATEAAAGGADVRGSLRRSRRRCPAKRDRIYAYDSEYEES